MKPLRLLLLAALTAFPVFADGVRITFSSDRYSKSDKLPDGWVLKGKLFTAKPTYEVVYDKDLKTDVLRIRADRASGTLLYDITGILQKYPIMRWKWRGGSLPEDAGHPEYWGIIAILRHIVERYRQLGIRFLFETGQETPVTLLRVIEELGAENVGINMDTANLILYGKANSADAVRVFGRYVRDTHIKDGFYPTDGKNLGCEVKVGEGLANIPEVVRQLRAVGYRGNYIIEREISGDQQTADLTATLEYMKRILAETKENTVC